MVSRARNTVVNTRIIGLTVEIKRRWRWVVIQLSVAQKIRVTSSITRDSYARRAPLPNPSLSTTCLGGPFVRAASPPTSKIPAAPEEIDVAVSRLAGSRGRYGTMQGSWIAATITHPAPRYLVESIARQLVF